MNSNFSAAARLQKTPILATLVSLLLLSMSVYGATDFFFPNQSFFMFILIGLWGYSSLEFFLLSTGRIRPIVEVMDHNLDSRRETLFIFVSSLVISLITKLIFARVSFYFLLVGWLILLLFHSYLSYQLAQVFRKQQDHPGWIHWLAHVPLWIVSLVLLILLAQYYKPMQVGPSENLTYGNAWAFFKAVETYETRGVLFGVPDTNPEADPSGYFRFEQVNNGDDVGYVLFQALASRSGLEPNTATNLKINRTFFVMGSLFLAWVAGAFIFRSPIAFLAIGASLFISHGFLSPVIYELADHHGAVMGISLLGMGLLSLGCYLIQRATYSTVVAYSFLAGLTISFLGLVRQSTGIVILASFLVMIILVAILFRKQRGLFAIASLIVFLLGYSFTNQLKETLFSYRDAALGITTSPESPGSHGIYFSLLGGVTEWNDWIIIRTIADKNPLAVPVFNTVALGEETKTYSTYNEEVFEVAKEEFILRVKDHPKIFLISTIQDIGEILHTNLNILSEDGMKILLILVILLGGGKTVESLWQKLAPSPGLKIDQDAYNLLIPVLIVVWLLAALVPAVTHIDLHFIQETIIVFLVLWILILTHIFLHKPGQA